MPSGSGDAFGNATAYQGYVGRWSRLVAQPFIAWLAAAPDLVWLDLGAGTGVLTEVILQQAAPARILGVDLSPEYIDFARARVHDPRVEFRVGDAAAVTFDLPAFDVSVAGLVLNFVPAPERAVDSMVQAVKAGGLVAAYVWDYGGHMEMMRHFWDAAIAVDPDAAEMDASQRFAICRPDNLRALFEAAGLRTVEVTPIDVPTHFKDFDDFWLPFLGAQGSVSKYLRGLSDDMRATVRDQLLKQLPVAADGSIALFARAWAVKGSKNSSA
ncbi:MAG: class I SAM-dependent methyltransferase [Anaerolineae bacterium]|nr:class I SAM-dependent methyltransferase [Anaerolineae bacterium]